LAKRNPHSEIEAQLERDRDLNDTSKIVDGLLVKVWIIFYTGIQNNIFLSRAQMYA
jgi:hypothetical protein